MKKTRSKIALIFAVLFILNATVLPAFATVPNMGAEQEIVAIDDGVIYPESRDNKVVVNEAITNSGSAWTQQDGYSSYKIWVSNTTNEKMTVTHTAGLRNDVFYVDANSSRVISVVNNALGGVKHSLDFATPSGVVSGTVSVRISDVNQSYG